MLHRHAGSPSEKEQTGLARLLSFEWFQSFPALLFCVQGASSSASFSAESTVSVAKAPDSVQRGRFGGTICESWGVGQPSMLKVEVRYEIGQEHNQGAKESQDSEPDQHECAFVLTFGRRGHAEDQMQPAKKFCQELDHGLQTWS